MLNFKGICTDFVSDIDKLFHAPERPSAKVSPARVREVARAERIRRLRDGKPAAIASKGQADSVRLWEDF